VLVSRPAVQAESLVCAVCVSIWSAQSVFVSWSATMRTKSSPVYTYKQLSQNIKHTHNIDACTHIHTRERAHAIHNNITHTHVTRTPRTHTHARATRTRTYTRTYTLSSLSFHTRAHTHTYTHTHNIIPLSSSTTAPRLVNLTSNRRKQTFFRCFFLNCLINSRSCEVFERFDMQVAAFELWRQRSAC
jgi:hypothetical protein